MLKEDFPCFKCLKRPICQNEERIECSDLFFIILNTADFDRSNKVMNGIIKNVLKQILFNVTHIVPEKDWKERLPYENDTM